MAAPNPRSNAMVKKAALIWSRAGKPKEILETPRLVCIPNLWRDQFKALQGNRGAFSIRGYSQRQRVGNDILLIDAVHSRPFYDFFSNGAPFLRRFRYALFVHGQRYNQRRRTS